MNNLEDYYKTVITRGPYNVKEVGPDQYLSPATKNLMDYCDNEDFFCSSREAANFAIERLQIKKEAPTKLELALAIV
jgi:hypothetical protein